MIRKLSATVAAGALMASAPAMADTPDTTGPVDFNAEVQVQEIATLEVENGTASMVVDDTNDDFQGQAGSEGSEFNASAGNLAVLKLSTNFTVDAVEIEFPTDSGFGPPDSDLPSLEFGVATNGDEQLGVFPQAGVLNDSGDIIGGGGGMFLHGGEDEPIQVTGETRDDDSGFGPGVHRIGVGVSTSWNRDRVDSDTEFADPGTYTIGMTASIVPNL
jgi:hypothetical protein